MLTKVMIRKEASIVSIFLCILSCVLLVKMCLLSLSNNWKRKQQSRWSQKGQRPLPQWSTSIAAQSRSSTMKTGSVINDTRTLLWPRCLCCSYLFCSHLWDYSKLEEAIFAFQTARVNQLKLYRAAPSSSQQGITMAKMGQFPLLKPSYFALN